MRMESRRSRWETLTLASRLRDGGPAVNGIVWVLMVAGHMQGTFPNQRACMNQASIVMGATGKQAPGVYK